MLEMSNLNLEEAYRLNGCFSKLQCISILDYLSAMEETTSSLEIISVPATDDLRGAFNDVDVCIDDVYADIQALEEQIDEFLEHDLKTKELLLSTVNEIRKTIRVSLAENTNRLSEEIDYLSRNLEEVEDAVNSAITNMGSI